MPALSAIRASSSVENAETNRSQPVEDSGKRRGGSRHRVRRNLTFSVLDGAFFSVMVGLGETYLSPFILALKGSQIASGLVTTLPLLCGAILQLATPFIVRRIGSHKRFIVVTAGIQAICMLCLPLAATIGPSAVGFVYVAAVFYYASGLAAGPAWNTWIEGIVPRKVRTRFFAFRVRTSQACILLGFILGGVSLQVGKHYEIPLTTFAILFFVAAVCRFASVICLYMQKSPRHPVRERHVGFGHMFRGKHGGQSSKLLTYLFSMQAAAFIAGPYFVPFMLKQLQMTYSEFAMLLGVSFVGKVVTLPLWGRLAHRAGAHRLLWIGGLSIIPMSALWLVSRSFWFLLALQFFAGLTWAAYELAFFLLFFETIPREERTSVLTIHNFGNSAAQVTGAFIGAGFLWHYGESYDSYLWLFGLSTVARALTVIFLWRVPKLPRIDKPDEPVLREVTISASE